MPTAGLDGISSRQPNGSLGMSDYQSSSLSSRDSLERYCKRNPAHRAEGTRGSVEPVWTANLSSQQDGKLLKASQERGESISDWGGDDFHQLALELSDCHVSQVDQLDFVPDLSAQVSLPRCYISRMSSPCTVVHCGVQEKPDQHLQRHCAAIFM